MVVTTGGDVAAFTKSEQEQLCSSDSALEAACAVHEDFDRMAMLCSPHLVLVGGSGQPGSGKPRRSG